MLQSLESSPPNSPVCGDVVVVGAGLAGLIMAKAMLDRGLRVILLESGGVKAIEGHHPLNSVEQLGQVYEGASAGRTRGLGGTSTRWGGALLPFLDNDFEGHPCGWHEGWGVSQSELAGHLKPVERDFGVDHSSYCEGVCESLLPSFVARSPKWSGFAKRSTANIYRDEILNHPNLQIWAEATLTSIRLDESRVSSVEAQSDGGNRLTANAPFVSLAAGAIETTRLLLLLNRQYDGRIFPKDGHLGIGFHDHLSAPVARLETNKYNELTRMFSFRFVKGGMRNIRFELAPGVRAKEKLPAAFAHIAFTRPDQSGFEALRHVYQALQRGADLAISDLLEISKDLPWFMRAGWWRLIEKRVLPPTHSEFELHLVTEQRPHPENRIALSETQIDRFGLPLASIDWRVRDEDVAHFHKIAEKMINEWTGGALANLATPIVRAPEMIDRDLIGCGGIYHPAGTTPMAQAPDVGVVDTRLRVHGVSGLWAVATSCFPSIGGTSPSLSLMQFARRAAMDIADRVAVGRGDAVCSWEKEEGTRTA